MKAVRIHEQGGSEKLRFEDSPEPELTGSQDAIVKLAAAAVNRSDIVLRSGAAGATIFLPRILGADGAGVVAAVGDEVKNLQPGDKVCLYPLSGCGACEFCASEREFMCAERRLLGEHENGTYAEYVRLPARNCFPLPAGLSFTEAAAFPSAYLTVWRMLMGHAELKPGEHLLIIGMGGIGTAALQLAVHLGARVIVVSGSDEKIARARALGAEQGINHKKEDFAAAARRLTGKRGVDVTLDCVGGEGWIKSLATLARGGRLVGCGAIAGNQTRTDLTRIFWNNLKIFGSTLGSRQDFGQVVQLLGNSRVKPAVDRTFPLEEAAAAQQRLERGEPFGKIVLTIGGQN